MIGKRRSVLKEVGTAVREQLPPGAFLELFVKVDKDWQRHAKSLERFGYEEAPLQHNAVDSSMPCSASWSMTLVQLVRPLVLGDVVEAGTRRAGR